MCHIIQGKDFKDKNGQAHAKLHFFQVAKCELSYVWVPYVVLLCAERLPVMQRMWQLKELIYFYFVLICMFSDWVMEDHIKHINQWAMSWCHNFAANILIF